MVTTVAGALAALRNLTTVVRGLHDTIKATGQAEAIGKLLEVQSAMLEANEKTQELIARIRELEDENRKLRDDADILSKLKLVGDIYKLEGAGNRDGNYCRVCYDHDGKLIRLEHSTEYRYPCWLCRICNGSWKG